MLLNAQMFAPGAGSSTSTPLFDTNGVVQPPNPVAFAAYAPRVTALQVAVERAAALLISAAAGVPPPPAIHLSLKRFPWPAYDDSLIYAALVSIVPIYMTLIFTLQVRVLLTNVLEEKESRVAMMLKMMGLADDVWWASWIITALVKNVVSVSLIALVASTGRVFHNADGLVVWVLFLLFELTCVGFALSASSFFSRAKTGGVFGMMLYLMLALPAYAFTAGLGAGVGVAPKIGLCIFAPFAFNLAIGVIMRSQQLGRPLGWGNLMDANLTPLGVPLGAVLGMLALDAVLYLLLAWYLNKVVPSEYGTPLHPCFCIGMRKRKIVMTTADIEALRIADTAMSTPTSRRRGGIFERCCARRTTGASTDAANALSPSMAVPLSASAHELPLWMTTSSLIEPVLASVAIRDGVHLQGLTKVFTSRGDTRLAVDSSTLSFYKGQVTCLLGHNGERLVRFCMGYC